MADTLKTLNCPACGKEMKKIFIPEQGINLDICTEGCGGIYFDNREFDDFDEQNENISTIIENLEGKNFSKPATNNTRICPNCGTKMVKNNSSVHKTIEIDECYACGAKFLDNNELVKIRAEYENNDQRDEDILRYLYKEVGQELAQQEQRYSQINPNKTFVRKLFYKLTGM